MLVVDIKSERIENCSKNWEELGWELIIIVNKMGLILIFYHEILVMLELH